MRTYDSPVHNACVRQTGKETVCFMGMLPGAALSADGMLVKHHKTISDVRQKATGLHQAYFAFAVHQLGQFRQTLFDDFAVKGCGLFFKLQHQFVAFKL